MLSINNPTLQNVPVQQPLVPTFATSYTKTKSIPFLARDVKTKMAETSRGRCATAIEKAIEELHSTLNANRINECTGRLKLILSDLKSKFLRTTSAAEEFVEYGGLRELIGVTKLCGRIKDSILGISIGCLANVCALSRNARAKVSGLQKANILNVLLSCR